MNFHIQMKTLRFSFVTQKKK